MSQKLQYLKGWLLESSAAGVQLAVMDCGVVSPADCLAELLGLEGRCEAARDKLLDALLREAALREEVASWVAAYKPFREELEALRALRRETKC